MRIAVPSTLAGNDKYQQQIRPIRFLMAGMVVLFLFMVIRGIGIYPVVFGDEWFYSSYSRLLPLKYAKVPSFLYLWVFRVTDLCGSGFLDCARVINSIFIVATAPFIYLVARRVCTPWVAAFVSVMAVAGPFNTYAIYFMPEAMYFALFWVTVWMTLRGSGSTSGKQAAGIGLLLGVLSLVKAHALFLLPGFLVFEAFRNWKFHAPEWRKSVALNTVLMLCIFAITKFGLGYLFAGKNGITLLGTLYGSMAQHVQYTKLTWAALRNMHGHLMGLTVLFGLPMAVMLAAIFDRSSLNLKRTVTQNDIVFENTQYIAVLCLCLLGPLLVITTYFSAAVVGGYETIARLHMRYYNFTFPFFIILAASQFEVKMRKIVNVTWIAAFVILLFSIYALINLLPLFTPSFVDSPELRGITCNPRIYMGICFTSIILTCLWVFRPAWASWVFVFFFMFSTTLVGNWYVNAEVRQRMIPDAYDMAGEFARKFLGQMTSNLVVVGSDRVAIYRTLFHIDNVKTQLIEQAPGTSISYETLPPGTDWLLLIGHYELPSHALIGLSMGNFSLQPVGQNLVIDLRLSSWPWIISYLKGLSTAEGFGTWSDGSKIEMEFAGSFSFDKPFTLKLNIIHVFPENLKEPLHISAGGDEKELRVSEPGEYSVVITPKEPVTTLTIDIHATVSPKDIGMSPDTRKLGIGLSSIVIVPDDGE